MPNCDINIVYMNIAKEIANMSYAERAKVGAVIVKDKSIVSFGYNGMPHGFDNKCETGNTTNVEVLHAESNAIAKIAKSTYSSEGSSLYVTMSPCFECSKLIIQSGIKELYYQEEYRIKDGLELLKKAGIKVKQIK